MERISQHNSGVLLGLDDMKDYEMLRYVYDGYTFAIGYKPIRKPKTRKKVCREFHFKKWSQLKAYELVGTLVQLDELKNAKSYKEFNKYMKTMLENKDHTYSIVNEIIFKVRKCEHLDSLLNNLHRYRTENY